MQPDYRLLIDRDGSGRFERLCTLLAHVEQLGSLRRATSALSLSYRYAWGLVRKAEERIGMPLLVSKTGGTSGGGAELTPAARDLLQRSRLLQQEVTAILGPHPTPEDTPSAHPLLMASTIGPVETGLVDVLVTAYHEATGVWIRYVAAGTGQALALARSGRVDLVLVHAPELEDQFIHEGYGVRRYPLACNRFVLCGPESDPAGVRSALSAAEAMRRIAAACAPFVSRGDQSGTHVKEMQVWSAAGIQPAGTWYQPWPLGGQGSAATLRHAAAAGAYTLVDSATFAINRTLGYSILWDGDPLLQNRFSLLPVNPARFRGVNHSGSERFAAWATGPEGRSVIGSFGVREYGLPLFQLPEKNA